MTSFIYRFWTWTTEAETAEYVYTEGAAVFCLNKLITTQSLHVTSCRQQEGGGNIIIDLATGNVGRSLFKLLITKFASPFS